ncbi:MAG: excinuclease ABC subunit B [Lachnospiraceae bacterium]|nr:excinuclease ABC subunit B [Lachnospiraceae bacterium]
MICEKCQEREATIFYTEIINGVKNEHNLCSECAKDMDFGEELPFAELLAGILGAYAIESEKKEDTMEQVVCPSCKTTYRDFISHGVFGCEDCYNVFEPLIEGNIKKIQGNSLHTGKKPKYNVIQKESKEEVYQPLEEIRIMRERLKEALAEEDYEEAARLRDEIKAVKERNGIDA